MDKPKALAELIDQRRSETNSEYCHLHNFDGGYWDFDFLVPWTKSACDLDAQLMIVGQDWASEEFLRKHNSIQKRADRKETGQDAWLQTNKKLKVLLKNHFALEFANTYATDVSVFIKPGKMSGDVPMSDLLYCAKKYTLPQIAIVQPRVVLCLGAKTFNSVRAAIPERQRMKWSEAQLPSSHTIYKGSETYGIYEGSEIYGVPHTGGQGIANARGNENVDRIWKQLSEQFRKLTTSQ